LSKWAAPTTSSSWVAIRSQPANHRRAKRQGIKLSPKQLFEKQTIGQLAAVAKLIESKPAASVAQKVSGELPLLPIQARFFQTDIPQRHHWNQSVMLQPQIPLDATHLHNALAALIEQHDALSLSFQRSGEIWQATFQAQRHTDLLWVRALDDLADLPRWPPRPSAVSTYNRAGWYARCW